LVNIPARIQPPKKPLEAKSRPCLIGIPPGPADLSPRRFPVLSSFNGGRSADEILGEGGCQGSRVFVLRIAWYPSVDDHFCAFCASLRLKSVSVFVFIGVHLSRLNRGSWPLPTNAPTSTTTYSAHPINPEILSTLNFFRGGIRTDVIPPLL
jgi:hypothetical protein